MIQHRPLLLLRRPETGHSEKHSDTAFSPYVVIFGQALHASVVSAEGTGGALDSTPTPGTLPEHFLQSRGTSADHVS